jgi:hypothetical protein
MEHQQLACSKSSEALQAEHKEAKQAQIKLSNEAQISPI